MEGDGDGDLIYGRLVSYTVLWCKSGYLRCIFTPRGVLYPGFVPQCAGMCTLLAIRADTFQQCW
jgi:hypothetical protein